MVARANGAEVQVPTFGTAIADFDAALAEAPEQVADPAKYELMQALGLR